MINKPHRCVQFSVYTRTVLLSEQDSLWSLLDTTEKTVKTYANNYDFRKSFDSELKKTRSNKLNHLEMGVGKSLTFTLYSSIYLHSAHSWQHQ